MAWSVIPLDTTPDQILNISVEVENNNLALILHLRYNTEGEFWHMDVSDGNSGEMFISNMPLVTGEYPAANILRQFAHMGLGIAVVLPVTNQTAGDIPGLDDLGTDFVLIWGSDDVG